MWDNEKTSSDSSEPLLKDDDVESGGELQADKRWRSTIPVLTILNVFVFACSVFLFMSVVRNDHVNEALKATSIYSPVLEDIELRLDTVHFNGSLWPGNNTSPWRRLPGTETWHIWDDTFETIKPMVLSKDQILKIGKNPDLVAKYEESFWHMGDDAYIGALDFFHQVHCLNSLRKEAFAPYQREGESFPQYESLHWTHLRHCTDLLMQHLLCTADTGIMTYNWMEDQHHPFPDMSVNRKCKDWRQLIEYRDAHSVDLDKYVEYTKPDGVRELLQPAEYWEFRDHEGS